LSVPRPRTVSDDAIIDATLRAIDRHGPARMTLADVADDARLSPAAIVARFGSKHGLLLAVSRRATEKIDDDFADALSHTPSPLRALLDVLVATVKEIESPETLGNHVAFLQLDLVDPELRTQARAHARALQRNIVGVLDAAVRSDEIIATDTRRLARCVYTTFNGALISWALGGRGKLGPWVRHEIEFALAPYRA
jgi:AcrR family transcriptional regulator